MLHLKFIRMRWKQCKHFLKCEDDWNGNWDINKWITLDVLEYLIGSNKACGFMTNLWQMLIIYCRSMECDQKTNAFFSHKMFKSMWLTMEKIWNKMNWMLHCIRWKKSTALLVDVRHNDNVKWTENWTKIQRERNKMKTYWLNVD